MIQRIHRPQYELNITLRVDVIKCLPQDLAVAAQVDPLIQYDDAF